MVRGRGHGVAGGDASHEGTHITLLPNTTDQLGVGVGDVAARVGAALAHWWYIYTKCNLRVGCWPCCSETAGDRHIYIARISSHTPNVT